MENRFNARFENSKVTPKLPSKLHEVLEVVAAVRFPK